MAGKLTDKQQKFVMEYLVDLNATQAAIRAGYSAKTAAGIGFENLTKPNIEAAISKQRQRLEKSTEITQEMVRRELGKIAFFDIRKAFKDDGELKRIVDLDDDTAAAIAGVDVLKKIISSGDKSESMELLTHKIKATDKKGALEILARHLGMFDKDQSGAKIIFNNVSFSRKKKKIAE